MRAQARSHPRSPSKEITVLFSIRIIHSLTDWRRKPFEDFGPPGQEAV